MYVKKTDRVAAGIDLGGTNIKIALVGAGAKILAMQVRPTTDYKNIKELCGAMIEGISFLIKEKGLSKKDVIGAGVGTPGLVDSVKGVVYGLTNIPYWVNVPVKKIFEKELGIDTYVDNDVNLMALGELVHGAGRGAENLVCLTLGTGVGGAIILNGRLYRGATLSAGEIGHIVINEDGPRCMCGNYGCLESYVGNRPISQNAVSKIRAGEKSAVTKMVKGNLDLITPAILARAARQGDKAALSVWNETGRHLGILLSGVINFINPEVIVIGGGVANAGRLIFEPVRKTVKARAMAVPAKKVRIVKAELGERAGLIGAAVLASCPQFRAV